MGGEKKKMWRNLKMCNIFFTKISVGGFFIENIKYVGVFLRKKM